MEIRETGIEVNYKCFTRKFKLLWLGASTVNYISLSTTHRYATELRNVSVGLERFWTERRNVNLRCSSLFPGDIGIFDNTSVNRTTVTREATKAAFSGDWTFCPSFKPVCINQAFPS